MERKEFLKTLALGTVAICAGACVSTKSTTSKPSTVEIDLSNPANEALKNKNGYVIQDGLIVINTGEDLPVVLSAACPHMGKKVYWDPAVSALVCPAHGSRFDLAGKPTKGPAKEALNHYTVKKSGDKLTISLL